MERTTSLIIYTVFAIIGAAIIISALAQWRPLIQPVQACAGVVECQGRSNGERFCNDEATQVFSCIARNGCLQLEIQECDCVLREGVAYCAS
jgi:hypothetical protein